MMISSTTPEHDVQRHTPDSKKADQQAASALQRAAHPLQEEQDLDTLLADIGDARYVLLGEASHGTAEFYQWRATITQRLIQEKGFTLVAVEGDWPDAYTLNQYIQGKGAPGRALEVLRAFDRWPTWMWANTEIARLSEWMRTHNARSDRQVSFYGLDVYSLWESLEQLMTLPAIDPETASLVYQALQCFDGYRGDEQAYAAATLRGTRCNDVLNQLLTHVQTRHAPVDDLTSLHILQNAMVAVNAEAYYYAMVRDDADSWNIRDRHMAATLDQIMHYHGPDSKVIIWAHNTHVGDARYTDMTQYDMVNVGQLVRESHGDEGVYIVGFGTYQGTVVAGRRWGAPHQSMSVPASPAGSWDELIARVSPDNKIILLNQLRSEPALTRFRDQRAIGVVYNPAREMGNYVPTSLTERYDALIFLNTTQALTPLPVQPQVRKEASQAPVSPYALIND